ncbi:cytochrome oxidase assembly family protein [Mycobacterium xenopi 3993]|nr:cytochrome oxidase assembly family protein [Mycobacterium xenopi 3993]
MTSAGRTPRPQHVPDRARLKIEITTLVHIHSSLLVAYLTLLVGLGFGLLAVHAPRRVLLRLGVLVLLVCGQALIGTVQFFAGVPAALVAVHVAGATLCTAGTAALWASMRERASPNRSSADSTHSANCRSRSPRAVSAVRSTRAVARRGRVAQACRPRGHRSRPRGIEQLVRLDADLVSRGPQRGMPHLPQLEIRFDSLLSGKCMRLPPPRKPTR